MAGLDYRYLSTSSPETDTTFLTGNGQYNPKILDNRMQLGELDYALNGVDFPHNNNYNSNTIFTPSILSKATQVLTPPNEKVSRMHGQQEIAGQGHNITPTSSPFDLNCSSAAIPISPLRSMPTEPHSSSSSSTLAVNSMIENELALSLVHAELDAAMSLYMENKRLPTVSDMCQILPHLLSSQFHNTSKQPENSYTATGRILPIVCDNNLPTTLPQIPSQQQQQQKLYQNNLGCNPIIPNSMQGNSLYTTSYKPRASVTAKRTSPALHKIDTNFFKTSEGGNVYIQKQHGSAAHLYSPESSINGTPTAINYSPPLTDNTTPYNNTNHPQTQPTSTICLPQPIHNNKYTNGNPVKFIGFKQTKTKPKSYPCTLCPTEFNTTAALRYHLRKIHGTFTERALKVRSRPRPYECTTCEKDFSTKAGMRHHRSRCKNLALAKNF